MPDTSVSLELKIMEEPVKTGECDIEMVVPPKKKTLKQARLPFQMLSSMDSPNTNKKRKLLSPTPVECKSPKLVKITTKENSCDITKSKEPEVVDLDSPVAEDQKANENSTEKEVDQINEKESPSIKITPKSKPKKSDEKLGIKPGALTRFFTKTENKEKADSKETKNDDDAMDCELINEHNEASSSGSKKQEPESLETQESKFEKSAKIEELILSGKSDFEKEDHDSKDSLPSSKSTSKAGSDKEDNSRSEQDPQDIDVSKIESDTESSGDDLDTDQRADNDESEDKKKSVITPNTKKERDIARQKKMTPKQMEKKIERQKRRDERQKQRLEREKKKEEERQSRKREKEEKRKEKEEKEKAEREQRKKEKEQKELKKQMEIEQKQKEKEAKEEDRRKREEAKEEEKRRKEEEKLEAERKKQKAASSFVSFFVAKKPTESKTVSEQKTLVTKNFMPFEVKADMRVAPICRRIMGDDEKLKFDETWDKQCLDKSQLYLEEIRNKKVTKRKSEKTWPFELKDDEDDVVIIENEGDISQNCVDRGNLALEKHRAKLLMFTENRRPPYRGTWRKKSSSINPRKPFVKDTKWFDYEIDSDEEWEEEEPGESLRGSDDEKDEENPDDNEYDVDNEFMVPHGYLSEEEAQADDEDEEDMNPETQKLKIKLLGEQFEAEMKTKTSKLKPKVIGSIWQNSDSSYASSIHPQVLQFLMECQAWVKEIPVTLQSIGDNESFHGSDCGTPSRRLSSVGPGAKKTRVPEEAMPDLIRLVHGNVNGRGFLVKEFMSFWSKRNDFRVSKVSLSKKIREIARWAACTEEGPMYQKTCWYVNEEVRKKYLGDEDCGLPNRWNYTLIPKKKFEVPVEAPEKPEKDEKEKEKKSVPLITQFTKKITQEEMKKQLTEKSAVKSTPPQSKPGKRVALISVGRGEQFPKSSRVSLLDKFVSGESSNLNKEVNKNKFEDDDIMIIEDGEDNKVKSQSEVKEKNLTKGGDSKVASVFIKNIESEDDGIMLIEDSEDAKYPSTQEGKETSVEKIEQKLSFSLGLLNSEAKTDQIQKEDKSKMETSTAEATE